jgi:membrane-associated phospholipid phosphatase
VWTSWKVSIPEIVPFHWDAAFIAADRALLGGHDAWRLTHAVLGWPLLTRLVDVLYLPAWGLQQSIVLPLAAIAPPGALRRRFIISYLLGWVLSGNVAAIWFSSVGPCYLGILAGNAADAAPFAPLMQKLNAMHDAFPMTSIRGQRFLLAAAQGRIARMAGGISAFPSMHVTASTLVAIAAWRVSRRWGRIATAFAIVVLIGSVHLGWHYLVDGLAGAAIAAALWWGVGLFVRDREEKVTVAAPSPPTAR